jgi:outer membrane protein assembly factor BamB
MTISDLCRHAAAPRAALLTCSLIGGSLFTPMGSAFAQATAAPAVPAAGASAGAPKKAPVRASNWPILGGGATRTGVADEIIAPPLSLLWRYTAGAQGADPCAPIVAGGTVFYAARGDDSTGSGALYGIDTATGARRWRFSLTGNNLFRTAPTFDNGIVYIGASDGNMYAVDANTGKEIVHYHTPRPINSSPLVVNNVLYFGSDDGTFYALDPQSGNPIWHKPYNAGDAINSAPVVSDSFVFFTTVGNSVQAVKTATGLGRWSFRLPFRVIPNAPIYADNTLYVPAGPRLFAFQPTSGNIRWARDLINDIMCTPVDVNGIVYLISRDEIGNGARIYAVRSTNGKDFWAKPASIPIVPAAAPTVSGNVMYIPTIKNLLLAISLDDGHILWQYHVDPSVNRANVIPSGTTSLTTPVALAGGALYAMSDDGTLAAYRTDAPDNTGPVLYSMYPAVSQRVNGAPPLTLASYVDDQGSGIDPSTIKMNLDDKTVVAKYDPYRSLISYQTRSTGKIIDQPLPNGRHSATISISDWRGNVSTQTWSFIVDSSVPRFTQQIPGPSGKRRSDTTNGNDPGGVQGGSGFPGGGSGFPGQ